MSALVCNTEFFYVKIPRTGKTRKCKSKKKHGCKKRKCKKKCKKGKKCVKGRCRTVGKKICKKKCKKGKRCVNGKCRKDNRKPRRRNKNCDNGKKWSKRKCRTPTGKTEWEWEKRVRWCKERKRRGIDYNDILLQSQIEKEKRRQFCFGCMDDHNIQLRVSRDNRNASYMVDDFACIEQGCYKDPSSEKDCTKCYSDLKSNSDTKWLYKLIKKYRINAQECDCGYRSQEGVPMCRQRSNECFECFKKICIHKSPYYYTGDCDPKDGRSSTDCKRNDGPRAMLEDTDSCYDNHCSMTFGDKICDWDH